MIIANCTVKGVLRGLVVLGLLWALQPGGILAEMGNRLYADQLGPYVHHGSGGLCRP